MARVSPLCVAERHETCGRLTYTGCLCRCHPEAPEPRAVGSASEPVAPVPVLVASVPPERFARIASWVMIGQGALITVLGVALMVWLLLQTHPHGAEALGLAVLLVLDVVVLVLSLTVGGTGLASRGPGLVAPIFGVLAHSLIALLALLLLAGGAWFIGIEVIPVELVLVFCFWLGVPWWRGTAPSSAQHGAHHA